MDLASVGRRGDLLTDISNQWLLEKADAEESDYESKRTLAVSAADLPVWEADHYQPLDQALATMLANGLENAFNARDRSTKVVADSAGVAFRTPATGTSESVESSKVGLPPADEKAAESGFTKSNSSSLPSDQAAIEGMAGRQLGLGSTVLPPPPAPPPPTAPAARRYGQSTLHFEPNRGQTSPGVQFLARGKGFNLSLTSTEAVFVLQKPLRAAGAPSTAPADQRAVLRLQLVGANPLAQAQGLDQQLGRSNYLRGRNPLQWQRNIPHYAKVRYANVYPGIDLVYYGGGNGGHQLEYDFVVAPGASVNPIRFAVRGTTSQRIDPQGQLILSTPGGDVIQRAPILYQLQSGIRQPVTGRYVLHGGDQVGFQVTGSYDTSRTLYLDPVIDYSAFFGGTGDDSAQGIAVENNGTAYLVGTTTSDDLPGSGELTYADGLDVFVTKLDADGIPLITTYLGGDLDDTAGGIALGASGVYVTGTTRSPNFALSQSVPLVQPYQSVLSGYSDAFVVILNPADLTLAYYTYVGGEGDEEGRGIAVDLTGNAYVTGSTLGGVFPTPQGFQQQPGGEGWDAFVARLNPTLSALGYGSYLGGEADDEGRGIAVNADGNAYVTGWTYSALFPTTPGAYREQPLTGKDTFVTKVSSTGSTKLYSTYLGGGLADEANAIALDEAGNAFVTGSTTSTDFTPSEEAFQSELAGGSDAFVTRLTDDGASIIYSTYLGGEGDDVGRAIVADDYGRAYVTGLTKADFPTTGDALQPESGGQDDGFLAEIGVAGTALLYSSYLGGDDNDEGTAIARDGEENVYLAGLTSSTIFPGPGGVFLQNPPAGKNAVVQKQNLPQINVVNVIPNNLSHEDNQDSEPSIGVLPIDAQVMAITTFSRVNGNSGGNAWVNDGVAPVWVSTNLGRRWNVRGRIPRPAANVHGPADQTLAYGSNGLLYGAFLGHDGAAVGRSTTVYVANTLNPNTTDFGPFTQYAGPENPSGVDQPWIQYARVADQNRIYVAYNDITGSVRPNTASIRVSTNGGTTFQDPVRIDGGTPVGQDAASVRVAVQGNRTYAIFMRYGGIVEDHKVPGTVVVVRDDSGGVRSETNPHPYRALGVQGSGVDLGIFPGPGGGFKLGQQRLGSDLSIAIDPNNADTVYVAYVLVTAAGVPQLFVRKSTNAGSPGTWENVVMINNAALPALAVSANGTLGMLYTRLKVNNRMSTEFLRVKNQGALVTRELTSWPKDNTPAPAGDPYIGDYQQLVAVGDKFYGAYSASNQLKLANYPEGGVLLQRYVSINNRLYSDYKLSVDIARLSDSLLQNVNISIDPYFFTAQEIQ